MLLSSPSAVGNFIKKTPTVLEVATGAVPADYAWAFLNTESDGSGIEILNSEYGTGLLIDLVQNANFVTNASGGFRGVGLQVVANSELAGSVKNTGLYLSFSGKSSAQALAVHNEFVFMHAPSSIVPKKFINFGGSFGDAITGASRGAYQPGTLGMMSAHNDYTNSLTPASSTRAAGQCHGGSLYIDRAARLRLARQSMANISAYCGVGYGDENILLVSTVVGMTTLVNKPIWPFSIDLGTFEVASGNTAIFASGYGDSEQWNTPFYIKKVYEKGTLTGNTNQITGTAGNTFITTPNSVALFTAGDLVQLAQGANVEYQEITSITGVGPYTVNFARPLFRTYTGATNHRIQVPTHNAVKVYNPGATNGSWCTTTKPYLEYTYKVSDISGRGADWVIAGEVQSDTQGWRIPFGNVGRATIGAGLLAVQVADASITNALDDVFVTPRTTTAVSGAPYVNAVNAPAGTFTVNIPVATGAGWDFSYQIIKYEMDR